MMKKVFKVITVIVTLIIFLSHTQALFAGCGEGGGGGGSSCFIAGTQITMADGSTKSIEDVQVGDYVLTYNEETQINEPNRVLKLETPTRYHYMQVTFDDGAVMGVTDAHPLLTTEGWKSINPAATKKEKYEMADKVTQALVVGDQVFKQNGEFVSIVDIQRVIGEIKVYDLAQVDGNHNYYADGFLAHNGNCDDNEPGGGGGCFIAGTQVTMSDGTTKNIEDVQAGDKVLTYNECNQQQETKTVLEVEAPLVEHRVDLYLANDTVISHTDNHAFYVKDKGWAALNPQATLEKDNMEVEQMVIGDYLLTESGNYVQIIDYKKYNEQTQTYNLKSVSGNHDYYVNHVLAHNKACFAAGTQILMGDGTTKNIEDVQVGDQVLTYNTYTGQQEIHEVLETENHPAPQILHVALSNGQILKVTSNHPLYTRDGWRSYSPEATRNESQALYKVLVGSYDVGDELLIADNSYARIEDITVVNQPLQIYNLKHVAGNHNFYADGVLAHNKGGSCFISGTQITMADGNTKNIEDVQEGDWVMGFNETTGEQEPQPVLEMEHPIREHYIDLMLANGTHIGLTDEHPIYTQEKGWASLNPFATKVWHSLDVAMLEVGDHLLSTQGEYVAITGYARHEGLIYTHNLKKVCGNNNYYADGFLVHNRGDEGCFIAGTQVTMSDGTTKNIEDVLIGEQVLTYNENAQRQEIKTVLEVEAPLVEHRVDLYLANDTVISHTDNHAFYVKDKGWAALNPQATLEKDNMEVEQMVIGDYLLTESGDYVQITDYKKYNESTQTYNLKQIEDNHSFYVNHVLAHNKDCFAAGTQILMADGSTKNIEDVVIGDSVVTYNERTGQQEINEVLETINHPSPQILHVTLSNGRVLKVTSNHPLYTRDGWKSYRPEATYNENKNLYAILVGAYDVGDEFLLADGSYARVEQIELINQVTQIYNLKAVTGNHNFYADDVLAHNKEGENGGIWDPECACTRYECPAGYSDSAGACPYGVETAGGTIHTCYYGGRKVGCYKTGGITCYKCKTCDKKTCSNYNAWSSNATCPTGYDTRKVTYSDGCGGTLECITCIPTPPPTTPPPPPPTTPPSRDTCPKPACGIQEYNEPIEELWDPVYDSEWNIVDWIKVRDRVDPNCVPHECKSGVHCCQHCTPGFDEGYGMYGAFCSYGACNDDICGRNPTGCEHPNCPSGDQDRHDVDYCSACGVDTGGDYGGVIQCSVNEEPKVWDPSESSDDPFADLAEDINCHKGNDHCCHIDSCGEINPDYDDEWDGGPMANRVFIPNPERVAGLNGNRCGKYIQSSQPFWTSAQANIYARDILKNWITNRDDDDKYIIHNTPDICVNSSGSDQAGLPMTSKTSSGDVFNRYNYQTQRSHSKTAVYPAFPQIDESSRLKQDFAYFASLIDYENLPLCSSRWSNVVNNGNLGTSPVSDRPHYACRVDGDTNTDEIARWGFDLTGNSNFTIFVQNDLTIKDNITVPVGYFKAFIIQGELKIEDGVGRDLSSCSSAGSCHFATGRGELQGVFVANSIKIARGPEVDPVFNRDATCDQQFNFEGVMAIWGKIASDGRRTDSSLLMTRSFKGCNLSLSYCDLNKHNPAHTFTYRPDFLVNAPHWMRQSVKLRLETL